MNSSRINSVSNVPKHIMHSMEISPQRRDLLQRALIALLALIFILTTFGVLMVFLATAASEIRAADLYGKQDRLFGVAIKQVFWVILGVFGALVITRLIKQKILEKLSHVIFGFALLMQFLVMFIGTDVGGNRNWIQVGPVNIQPSEFLKLALIIWLAFTLQPMRVADFNSKKMLVPLSGFLMAIALVVLPGDLGTALIFVLIGGGMFWLAGVRARHFILVLLFLTIFAGIGVLIRSSRLNRLIEYFMNIFSIPDIDNPTQSDFALFAFGKGGLRGVGLGAGQEKWYDLKAAHTDFIFAVIGEELGLFGTLLVVFLYLLLAITFFVISLNHVNRFGQLVTIGAALWICGQAFSNMLVAVGLFPVFGVPLPLLSQGGSSTLAVLLMVGVVVSTLFAVPGVRKGLRIWDRKASSASAIIRKNNG